MLEWIFWAVLLIAQQAAQTVVTRARNSKGSNGLLYHAGAAVFSNGVWFTSQLYIVTLLLAAKGDIHRFLYTLAFYVTFCVIGSVASHWFVMKWEQKHHIEHG
jgi:hypothetical protein